MGEKLSEPVGDKRKYQPRFRFQEFTEELHELYLQTLEETGTYIRACDSVGCDQRQLQIYRRDNPEFQELCNYALQRYRDAFVTEAARRAQYGHRIPVIGGPHKNEVVATKLEYSDRLLELFLRKGDRPDFSDNKTEVVMAGQLEIQSALDIRSLSKASRKLLRSLLEQMEEDHVNRAMGNPVDM